VLPNMSSDQHKDRGIRHRDFSRVFCEGWQSDPSKERAFAVLSSSISTCVLIIVHR
jgi:hypothetical protein